MRRIRTLGFIMIVAVVLCVALAFALAIKTTSLMTLKKSLIFALRIMLILNWVRAMLKAIKS